GGKTGEAQHKYQATNVGKLLP
ncbi:hypothetical protein D046_5327B, partial [Vibrio parahaemolyticus V-223/04]